MTVEEMRQRYHELAQASEKARRAYVTKYRACQAFVNTLTDEQFDDCAAYSLGKISGAIRE